MKKIKGSRVYSTLEIRTMFQTDLPQPFLDYYDEAPDYIHDIIEQWADDFKMSTLAIEKIKEHPKRIEEEISPIKEFNQMSIADLQTSDTDFPGKFVTNRKGHKVYLNDSKKVKKKKKK